MHSCSTEAVRKGIFRKRLDMCIFWYDALKPGLKPGQRSAGGFVLLFVGVVLLILSGNKL